MQSKTIKTLGINPGARHLGYALFQNSELRDWGIKAVKGKWTSEKKEKMERIFLNLLDHEKPDYVAFKKLHPARCSPELCDFLASLKRHCRTRRILVYEYPIKYLEEVVLTEKMNKKKLVESLGEIYPVLFSEAEKERGNKNSYYTRMFEAVALGHVCFNKLDN
jgi:hypothetical protein